MVKRHQHFVRKAEQPSKITIVLPFKMRQYLELEAKRIREETGRPISVQQLIRALVVSYKERRDAGIITHPDD